MVSLLNPPSLSQRCPFLKVRHVYRRADRQDQPILMLSSCKGQRRQQVVQELTCSREVQRMLAGMANHLDVRIVLLLVNA